MAWQNITVFPGNPIKASEINLLQANITAQAQGDAGAPKQQQAGIASGAVGRSQLKTSLGSGSSVNDGLYFLPGGQYGFYPNFGTNVSTPGQVGGVMFFDNQTVSVTKSSYYAHYLEQGNVALLWDQRYVNASPPYNLGDGEIAAFTFVKTNNQCDILGVYTADVPPWAYNGPTSVTPDRIDVDEKGIVRKYKYVMKEKLTPPWEGGDVDLWEKGPEFEEVEIDDAIKNADMPIIPHPFLKMNPGEKVLILEPCGNMSETLLYMLQAGENVAEMVTSGYLDFYEEVNCCKPPQVTAVRAKWKNTGG